MSTTERDGLREEIAPDWPAIHEALERNPAYQAACAEIDEADRQGPPEPIDTEALLRRLRPDRLRQEIAALDADQMHVLLLMLAGSDPDAVRQALDVERATRPAGVEAR